MKGAVESLKGDLAGLRTGRANTALLDPITVEVYGSHMPLNQLATVSAPEPRLLSVQVWDRPMSARWKRRSVRPVWASTRSTTATTCACRSPT
jgi:ribosome recycling factor